MPFLKYDLIFKSQAYQLLIINLFSVIKNTDKFVGVFTFL